MTDNDSFISRFFEEVRRYLWEARRGLRLRKGQFYREVSPLERIYNTWDCTMLCYGSMAGVGLHIILMSCLQKYGAMMLFSVLITAIGTLISCMCYAELASLAPSTGAVYHYCYHTIGELVAFLVGWNVVFAYTLCCSYAIRFLSRFIDFNLLNHYLECKIYHYIGRYKSIGYEFFTISNDLVLGTLVLSLSICGINTMLSKISKQVFNISTIVAITFTYICLLMYAFYIDFSNLTSRTPKSENQFDFFVCAAAHMTYSFSGYEVVICLGEEAIQPSKTIPKSLLIAIKICTASYILMTALHLLAWPYEDQDMMSPVSYVLLKHGLWPLNYAAIFAAITGMFASAFASMVLVIRITYAMSRDGLLPSVFSRVSRNTKVPVVQTVLTGFIVGILAAALDEKTLGTISEVGTVFSKVMASICLLITRYRCEKAVDYYKIEAPRWVLVNYPARQDRPTKTTQTISKLLILNLVLAVSSFLLLLKGVMLFERLPFTMKAISACILVIFLLLAVCLYRQPQNDRSNLYYMVRGVPTIPLLVLTYDLYTIINIGVVPWISFSIWTILGILFYFAYSVSHSMENRRRHADGRVWNTMRSSINIDTPSVDDPYSVGLDSSESQMEKEEEKKKKKPALKPMKI